MTAAPVSGRSDTELGRFLHALWTRRWWVVGGTGLAVLAAVAGILAAPDQYEATARLAIAEFRIDDTSARDQWATYAELIRSQTLAQRIVDEHGLEGELGLDAEELLERVSVRLVPGTSLVEMGVELPDPQLSLEVCSDLARQAEELTRRINDSDQDRARRVLEQQLTAADEEVQALEHTLSESGGEATVRALERELDLYLERRQALEEDWLSMVLLRERQNSSGIQERLVVAKDALAALRAERRPQALRGLLQQALGRWSALRDRRAGVSAELSAESGRLAQAETELAGKERILEVMRTLGDELLLAESARSRRNEEAAPLQLQSEYVNPVHEELEITVSRGRANVAALEDELAEVDRLIDEYRERSETLERELADVESALETRERDVDLAVGEYRELFAQAPEGVRASIRVLEDRMAANEADIDEARLRLATASGRLERLQGEFQTALGGRATLARQLDASEVTVAGQIAELILVDPPILPTRPSGPSAIVVLAVALVVGALLSLLVVSMVAGLEATAVSSH